LLLLNLVFVVADQRFATLIRILGIKPRDEGEAEHSGPKLGKEADVLYGSFKRVLSRILLGSCLIRLLLCGIMREMNGLITAKGIRKSQIAKKHASQRANIQLNENSQGHECAPVARLRLQTLLEMCSHPKHGEDWIRNLAGNTPLAHQLKALTNLWLTLGCPSNIFWRELRVPYNDIVDCPDSEKS
jgi:hypothetical protein